jgi:hypothetical protein
MKTTSTDQKKNTALYRRMEETYGRYKASKLSRKAFCKAEGLSLAQFTYWCQRFDKELSLSPTPEKAKPGSPIPSNPPTIPTSGFKEIILASQASLPVAEMTPLIPPVSETTRAPTPPSIPATVALTSPVMVLDLPGKARLEFYSQVEVDFLCTLLQKGC